MKIFSLCFFLLLLTLPGMLPAQVPAWQALNQKSVQHYHRGEYKLAEQTATKALQEAQRQAGMVSKAYITGLSNLGYAQRGQGKYTQALQSFKRAAGLSFQLYGRAHVSQITSLGEVARLWQDIGMYDSTEYYLQKAQELFKRVPAENPVHQDTASVFLLTAYIKINAQQASLYYRKGQPEQAIRLLEAQLPLLKSLYPTNFSTQADYQQIIHNLSVYYIEWGKPQAARQYALTYARLVQGNTNLLDKIYAWQELGNVYRNLQELDSALYYWQKALHTIQASAYRNSYVHQALLNNLGELYLFQEAYPQAIAYLETSLKTQKSNKELNGPLYRATLSNLAESYRWAGSYARADTVYRELMKELMEEIVHNFTYLSEAEKLAFYEKQLSYLDNFSSFALEVSGLLPLQATDSPYVSPQIAGRLYDLQLTTKALILNVSKRMKQLILSDTSKQVTTRYLQWEADKKRLSQALLTTNRTYLNLSQLRQSIEENEKWLIRHSAGFKKGFKINKTTWQQVQQTLGPNQAAVELIRLVDGLVYGALILTPQTTGQPVFTLVMSTRNGHLEKQYYHYYRNTIKYRHPDTLSYGIYWQPIIEAIRDHMPGRVMPSRVYLSNDGIYNQLNVNTFYNPHTNKYVLDETEVVLLTNTRELLSSQKILLDSNLTAALFGDPAFGSKGFGRLPGSGQEVEQIDSLLKKAGWRSRLFTKEQATESRLKKLAAPRVLHLATHGYFNPQPAAGHNSFTQIMIQSGVVLAEENDLAAGYNDGILTAYEVTDLNLEANELVVLSACQTGLGVSKPGEGVYGLQRAFEVAGANHILMSLWQVNDAVTRELMVQFYARWLQTGDSRGAFIKAQQYIRQRHPQPYYWGAFVMSGG